MIGPGKEKRNLDVLPLTRVNAFLNDIFRFAETAQMCSSNTHCALFAISLLNQVLGPDMDAVANALARKFGRRIQEGPLLRIIDHEFFKTPAAKPGK